MAILESMVNAVSAPTRTKKDELARPDSHKFFVIADEVKNLHKNVWNAREQISDGEARLGMAKSLEASMKCNSKQGISISDFVSCLLRDFGHSHGGEPEVNNSISWKDIGLHVSTVFMKAHGCSTMFGPVSETKTAIPLLRVGHIADVVKPKRIYRKRKKPTEAVRPEEFEDTWSEQRTDTGTTKTMSMMFKILKKKPGVVLESLILNRSSFPQTVENLFALSFLAKDGRVEITVEANGSHLVSPKNAPDAASVASREVNYNHFVLRLDFVDWKMMKDVVLVGEELMPHRSISITPNVEAAAAAAAAADIPMATPIRKVSRNRGQKISIAQEYPQGCYDAAMRLLPLVAVVSPN